MNLGSSSTRDRLRSRLRAQVSDAILDAAEELFAARGVHQTPLTAIAKRAGVAVGTLYNYHVDRDALVHALFESRRAALVPQIAAIGAAGAALAFEPRLRHFVAGVLALFDANQRFLKIALETEHLRSLPGGKRAITTIGTELAAIVDAGITARLIGKAQRELLPRLLAGAIKSSLMLRVERDQPAAGDAEAIVDMFLRGALLR
jgi:AcrR family transcriptional regulator